MQYGLEHWQSMNNGKNAMDKLTLDEAKRLYASTGYCEHFFPTDPYSPYGCEGTVLVTCKVCAKEIERTYC